MLRLKTNILTPVSAQETRFIPQAIITIEKDVISGISTNGDYDIDLTQSLCLPGFIDTHVHLSQHFVRGRHCPHLLDWLNLHIFQEERRSRDAAYARQVATCFFADMVSAGTTTAVIYTAPFAVACNTAFEAAESLGVRALIGKTMMDQNCPDYLRENTLKSVEESIELYRRWHDKSPLLDYIFTPRFAPTCSSVLMEKTADFASSHDAFIQTHLSENTDEIAWVKELFPASSSYTAVYADHGLLTPRTLLGHCIHLQDAELALLAQSGSAITHCPDSNFFLKSGAFPWRIIEKQGIPFALASDVGAGTTLAMPHVMQMAHYRQEFTPLSLEEVFYRATLAGAEILHQADTLGSIAVGKQADLVFRTLPNGVEHSASSLLSLLTYRANELPVNQVYIAGKKVHPRP
ncbi:MAG: guanine deaminase [Candidatus Cloacimonetes bacterium]|nr:guanine deaminase [Candidatus Cloacimonadota bacterium]